MDEYIIVGGDGSVTAVAEGVDIFEYVKEFGGIVVSRNEYAAPPYVHTTEEIHAIENAWRAEQMLEVADQLLMIEDDDPNAKPGTARQWRDYRIQLRLWTDTNPDFPDISKRPVQPS